MSEGKKIQGRCACGQVVYEMTPKPLIVHCCHCRDCQRLTGGAYALNALIEADRVQLLSGELETVIAETPSGAGQKIARCPDCKVALWSNYLSMGPAIRFVRVGTLEEPDQLPPDIHIYTSTKQPWVILPDGAPVFAHTYDKDKIWSPDSLARRDALTAA